MILSLVLFGVLLVIRVSAGGSDGCQAEVSSRFPRWGFTSSVIITVRQFFFDESSFSWESYSFCRDLSSSGKISEKIRWYETR